MKYSLLDHFSVIEPCIAPSFMDKARVDSIQKLCALFPFDIADDFGFESRLGNREALWLEFDWEGTSYNLIPTICFNNMAVFRL